MEDSKNTDYDLIVLGAGPAGLTAAQYSARAGLKTLVLDQGLGGGQAANIFMLENYPGVFPAVKGAEWISTMKEQAAAFGAEIRQEAVSSADKIEGRFEIKTYRNRYRCDALIAATGAEHRKLGVPGEDEFSGRGVSYCASCDGPFFKGQEVVVAGGGDSACDEALYLSTICSRVTMVHRRSEFRAQKAIAQKVLANPGISVMFNSSVTGISGDRKVSAVEITDTLSGQKKIMQTSAVFIFVGMTPQTSLFSNLKTDGEGYLMTGEDMSTSVPGLFAAGDVRAKPFRQIVTACSDGAVASHSAQEYIRRLRNEEYR